jgi:hypothetical protein
MKTFQIIFATCVFMIGVSKASTSQTDELATAISSSDTELESWRPKLSVYPAKYLSNSDLGTVTYSETPMNLHVTFNNNKTSLRLEITTLNGDLMYQVSIAPKTQIHILDFTDFEQNIYFLNLLDDSGNRETFEVIKMD